MFSSIFFKNLTKFTRFAKIQQFRLRSDLTEVIHTGQVWAEDDYRNVRFTNSKRWVNKNWGMKYGHKQKTTVTSKRVAVCDGGGPLGHPISYICLDKPGKHYCHYCLKSFIFEKKY